MKWENFRMSSHRHVRASCVLCLRFVLIVNGNVVGVFLLATKENRKIDMILAIKHFHIHRIRRPPIILYSSASNGTLARKWNENWLNIGVQDRHFPDHLRSGEGRAFNYGIFILYVLLWSSAYPVGFLLFPSRIPHALQFVLVFCGSLFYILSTNLFLFAVSLFI